MFYTSSARICHKCGETMVVTYSAAFIPRDSCPDCDKEEVENCEMIKLRASEDNDFVNHPKPFTARLNALISGILFKCGHCLGVCHCEPKRTL